MGDIKEQYIKKTIDWMLKNKKKCIIPILIILFGAILIYPILDANFLAYSRIEKRVHIMQEVTKIDLDRVYQDPLLNKEYEDILHEMEMQKSRSINNIITVAQDDSQIVKRNKFISGGLLLWIIAACIPFMDTFNSIASKVGGFIIVIVIGFVLAWIGILIPTIFNEWVNYIGWPAIQLITIIVLCT